MSITSHKTQIRTIRYDDPRFIIKDKYIIAKRAGIEVSQRCPENYKNIIQECLMHGWIKPIAYMTERELLFVGLNEDLNED